MTDEDILDVELRVARDPEAGVLIQGSGGARKLRTPARGQGKRGGNRVVTYFGGRDLPVFLITVFAKNERIDLTDEEVNLMRRELKALADDYRRGGSKQ